jgi:hypothetical protein
VTSLVLRALQSLALVQGGFQPELRSVGEHMLREGDHALDVDLVEPGFVDRHLGKGCLGPVSKAYRAVDRHTASRLRQWLRRKHKVQGRGTARFPDAYLYQTLNSSG